METTTPPTQAITPSPVSVMGAGEEIRNIEDLKNFHTPDASDGDTSRNYHSHNQLTPHYEFAQAVVKGCSNFNIEIDDIAFKVDSVQSTDVPLRIPGFPVPFLNKCKAKVANRFFLIARIKNKELQLADDVETYIIARNSHDKRLPMELAIGNKVIVCSNLMFGGDIHVKAKNSRFGFNKFNERMFDLLSEYKDSVKDLRSDIIMFKNWHIAPEIAHAFIGLNSSDNNFVQPGRTHRVHAMFNQPEHPEGYRTSSGAEQYTLWRLLNAYTYVHRGELAIDKETKEPYAEGHSKYGERTNVCPLPLKRDYTNKLWQALVHDNVRNVGLNWDKQPSGYSTSRGYITP